MLTWHIEHHPLDGAIMKSSTGRLVALIVCLNPFILVSRERHCHSIVFSLIRSQVQCTNDGATAPYPQFHAGFCILTFTWQTRRLSVWVGLLVWRKNKKSKYKSLGNSKAKKNGKIQKPTLRKFCTLITIKWSDFYRFTVVCSVIWPLNGSEISVSLFW